MSKLSSDDVWPFLAIITLLLVGSRITGEIYRKFKMSAMMGALTAGILPGSGTPVIIHSQNLL